MNEILHYSVNIQIWQVIVLAVWICIADFIYHYYCGICLCLEKVKKSFSDCFAKLIANLLILPFGIFSIWLLFKLFFSK